jgi:hypothetical protein
MNRARTGRGLRDPSSRRCCPPKRDASMSDHLATLETARTKCGTLRAVQWYAQRCSTQSDGRRGEHCWQLTRNASTSISLPSREAPGAGESIVETTRGHKTAKRPSASSRSQGVKAIRLASNGCFAGARRAARTPSASKAHRGAPTSSGRCWSSGAYGRRTVRVAMARPERS